MRPIVAFQGESGAFSEAAAERLVDGPVALLPCPTFQAVVDAVVAGQADYGALPEENRIAGPVTAALDALAATSKLQRVREHVLPVRLALLGVPGATVEGVREALSHAMALKQCRRFLAAHPLIRAVEAHDTAGAARMVALRNDPGVAAIAAPWAAGRYRLVIVAEGLEDEPDNWTRFVLVKRVPGAGPGLTGVLMP